MADGMNVIPEDNSRGEFTRMVDALAQKGKWQTRRMHSVKGRMWALLGSNQRPADYESAALTN